MKIKLQRKKIVKAFLVLNQFLQTGGEQEFKFNYAVIRNKDKLENYKIDYDIKIQEFDLDRVELCEKLCKKDENGKAIIIDNNYQFDNPEEFKEKVKVISDKKKAYEEEEIEFEGFEIPREYMPKKMVGAFQEIVQLFLPPSDVSENEVKVN